MNPSRNTQIEAPDLGLESDPNPLGRELSGEGIELPTGRGAGPQMVKVNEPGSQRDGSISGETTGSTEAGGVLLFHGRERNSALIR
jgi:hypothetical protein